ncbi:hypothetical protein NHN26_11560 [Rhodovulum tesquicola]|uniref:hypothetical protein n=1 Tax=Rhodovulum tesquicola TaxID=540254 RepID=UPI002096E363|nr:hypothetical protein [Rhodovulum tesquicola]MCO8145863.1 hypothetical protein [Rhodovulum tesquicola]
MTPLIRPLAAIAVALVVNMPAAAPAQSYQVDCAILLCLAGGWPTSAPCAHARAVFIRRITPWPVEPPLQIWRCPMGASFAVPARALPLERLHDITFRTGSSIAMPTASLPVLPVQASEQADIDISGDAFDFVRSIRVFHIQFHQREDGDGRCIRSDSTRLGSYGEQGDYRWARSSVTAVPSASALPRPKHCDRMVYRSVFVDWRDHAGSYGFEEVRY